MPRTSIVILTLNELPVTKLCLESIAACTPEPHEIIVVDNGSSDGTVQHLRGRDVRLIANRENRGFAGGCNQGILAAGGEHILLLNNDVVVTPGWLGGLQAALQSAPRVGLSGPVSNCVSGPQLDPGASYSTVEGLMKHAAARAEEAGGRVRPVERLVGFCLLLSREVVERIGLLDERFGRGNFEDDDFCRRARVAGYGLLIADGVFVHHFGSRTFAANRIDYGEAMEKNRAVFLAKWSREPDPRDTPCPSVPLARY